MDQDIAQRKIFIGGLSYGTDDDKLREYFSQFGPVQDAVVMKDPVTRRSRGFGFITFEHPHFVDNALAVENHVIDSRKVEAKRSVPRSEFASSSSILTPTLYASSGAASSASSSSSPSSLLALKLSGSGPGKQSGGSTPFMYQSSIGGVSYSKILGVGANNSSGGPGSSSSAPIVHLSSTDAILHPTLPPPPASSSSPNTNRNQSLSTTPSIMDMGGNISQYPSLHASASSSVPVVSSSIGMNMGGAKVGSSGNSPRPQQQSQVFAPHPEDYSFNKIFVGGLHYDTRDDEFRGYFERYGRVISAEVMLNRETHKSRGFGFIIFESEDSVDLVCSQKEHFIDGKLVEVKRAVPRSKLPNSSPTASPISTTGSLLANMIASSASATGGPLNQSNTSIRVPKQAGPSIIYPSLRAQQVGYELRRADSGSYPMDNTGKAGASSQAVLQRANTASYASAQRTNLNLMMMSSRVNSFDSSELYSQSGGHSSRGFYVDPRAANDGGAGLAFDMQAQHQHQRPGSRQRPSGKSPSPLTYEASHLSSVPMNLAPSQPASSNPRQMNYYNFPYSHSGLEHYSSSGSNFISSDIEDYQVGAGESAIRPGRAFSESYLPQRPGGEIPLSNSQYGALDSSSSDIGIAHERALSRPRHESAPDISVIRNSSSSISSQDISPYTASDRPSASSYNSPDPFAWSSSSPMLPPRDLSVPQGGPNSAAWIPHSGTDPAVDSSGDDPLATIAAESRVYSFSDRGAMGGTDYFSGFAMDGRQNGLMPEGKSSLTSEGTLPRDDPNANFQHFHSQSKSITGGTGPRNGAQTDGRSFFKQHFASSNHGETDGTPNSSSEVDDLFSNLDVNSESLNWMPSHSYNR